MENNSSKFPSKTDQPTAGKVQSSKPKIGKRFVLFFSFVLLLLAFGFFLLSSWERHKIPIKNTDSKGANIVCFGDSITFGYGVNPGQDYPTELSRLLNKLVINAGVDGDTTTMALERIKTDCLDKNPRLVIIEFCGNDFLKKVPQETTLKNLREIIRLVQANGAMAAVVDISAGMFFAEYRKVYAKIAQETGAIFIPHILEGIITNPSMKSDFLHPNAEGYKIVAQRILRAITPYLQ